MPAVSGLSLLVLWLLLLGCGSVEEHPKVIEKAYVGPHELELLAELSRDSPVAATLKHGQELEILEWKRRFAKVRTPAGVTGWTDGQMLLNTSQMARLRMLSVRAAGLPSQGKATVYDVLNVHTEPRRGAPSFHQLQAGLLVDVVAHQLLPRDPSGPDDEEAEPIFPLNCYEAPGEESDAPGKLDDWSLVRLADGRAGWVVTGMLTMAIPDEVAQYAEGHRITSYFPLARVEDGGETKHHWLWTTLSETRKPYQFDSFRVFVWSLRRHRYETAYIERNVVGYFPVQVRSSGEGQPEFSLVARDKDGVLFRRTYAFQGYRVRMTDKAPWNPPAAPEHPAPPDRPEQPEDRSLWQTLKERFDGFGDGR